MMHLSHILQLRKLRLAMSGTCLVTIQPEQQMRKALLQKMCGSTEDRYRSESPQILTVSNL